ncbi:MAG: peptide deformylase [Paenibacillaceae bacterium]|jgi:peptide deformylase|nr:peptide deformylase [Paenibacillaceae bacterium]
MGVRPIVKVPHDVLRRRALPVRRITASLVALIGDMGETMVAARGIGLAAPQIGVSKRVIVVDIGDERGRIALVNPVIVHRSGSEQEWEGCLSIPEQYGLMDRAVDVHVRGLNAQGQAIDVHASGLLARVLQHEIDHLNGVLLFDHALDWEDQRDSKE